VTDFAAAMRTAFGVDRVRSETLLAPLTTFRVGGPAEWLIETRNSDEIETALSIARSAGVPVTMLGGGSNVLVADEGVRGLVIRARGGDVRAIDEGQVRADAAVTINGLVRWTINHGRAGLEAWAGTPGTVGGAIFGNAHFAGRSSRRARQQRATDRLRRLARRRSGVGDGLRIRLQPLAAIGRGAVVGGLPGVCRGIPRRYARLRASRSHSASARSRSTHRAPAVFQNPNAGATPFPTVSRGRLEPWSIGRA
jgi:UDP-N-acetylmuramate dehydrogenase